jgi:hypothetical protein
MDLHSSVQDVNISLQYTFDACINNCVLRNNAGLTPKCEGVTFSGNLTSQHYATGNCYVKTSITGPVPYTEDQVQASAWLLA